MTEIEIPFNDWSKKRLINKNKTSTSRIKRYGKKGDIFFVDTIPYEIIDVQKYTIAFVALHFFKEEGANSKEEFIKIWNKIHPKKTYEVDPFRLVWYHTFKQLNMIN